MLGKQLKLFREQNGYSQNQIAECLGTTRQTISNWEMIKQL
ncbi:Helix-turn-helix domain protein [Streptococcus oralis]|nr:Helix-turn-helix domain protein [Streptococcus oralis]